MSTDFSEDTLVEQPAIAPFSELGYETANCFHEKVGTSGSTLGRQTTEEVILVPKLRAVDSVPVQQPVWLVRGFIWAERKLHQKPQSPTSVRCSELPNEFLGFVGSSPWQSWATNGDEPTIRSLSTPHFAVATISGIELGAVPDSKPALIPSSVTRSRTSMAAKPSTPAEN